MKHKYNMPKKWEMILKLWYNGLKVTMDFSTVMITLIKIALVLCKMIWIGNFGKFNSVLQGLVEKDKHMKIQIAVRCLMLKVQTPGILIKIWIFLNKSVIGELHGKVLIPITVVAMKILRKVYGKVTKMPATEF